MNECNKSEDLWTPYKNLQRIILKQLSGHKECTSEFETTLRKHCQTFFSLLQNPKKNAKSRQELKKGMQDGITLKKLGHQILSKELYQEAIILSDMYDMDEHVALDLLCTAQTLKPHHPGLPRGLVAVLLYYDGRKAIVSSLRLLVQARSGIQWSADIAPDVEKFVTLYTNHLMEGGVFNRIFELLGSLDLSKELEKLQQNLALGGPRHRRQIIHTFNEIRHILADIVFLWASQTGLPRDVTTNLLRFLKQVNLEEEASGKIDDVNMLLQMAFLATVDLSVLHTREDGEEAIQNLPIISDPKYISEIADHLAPNAGEWKCTGLHALSRFGLAVCVSSLHLLPESKRISGISTEHIFDVVIKMKLFDFLHNVFLENELIYKERFICKRLHYLFTDFIVYMYPKVKELRIRADDESRTMQSYLREGLEAPTQVAKPFEYLLLSIAKFYSRNVIEQELVLDFWSPVEINANQTYSYQTSPRAVSLFKFIRLVGDMVPKNLFVPFVKMLSSLCSCQQAARHCFNLLKLGTQLSLTFSWDHFFTSFSQYYSFLRQEAPVGDTIYRQRSMYQKGVQPQEIEGLQAVLLLISTIAKHDEFSRLALCEHPGWAPLTILLGLVGCPIPPALKADLLLTLAALSKSPENAAQMWENLESSQILVTVPSTSSYQSRGVQTELEEVESRLEEYPLTRAFLTLLDVLTDIGIPRTLGAGPRKPGFDPYLSYIIDSVFVKYTSRMYKEPLEKWMVAGLCLKLFEKFLVQYSPQVNDFQTSSEFNSPPGYHVMVQLSNRTNMLQGILDIINEGIIHFDTSIFYPTNELIVESILRSLSIIHKVLAHQQKFFSLMASLSSQTVIFSTITKILLHDINPRSGRPDYTLNIVKYITYQSSYTDHALLSVKILNDLMNLPKNHSSFVNNLFCSEDVNQIIKHGFTESLDTTEESALSDDLKLEILKLLKQCLPYNAPNLSHFLLGFNIKQDISKTEFQLAGVSEFPKSCLHSLIALMNSGVADEMSAQSPHILESAFNLLYLLASNSLTAGPVLRFLRMKQNFFQAHLSRVAKNMLNSLQEFNQMSWILKTLSVELKVANATKQLSYMKHLTNFLIDMPKLLILKKDSYNVIHKQGLSSSDITNQEISAVKVGGAETVFTPADDLESDSFLISLIPHFELKVKEVEMPYWEFFNKDVLHNILNKCQGFGKPKLIDLKRLHQVLYDELKNLQGTAVLGQIQAISQEIPKVLKYALDINKFRETAAAVIRFTDAWRQVAEVLSIYIPSEVLTPREQQLFSLQVVENVLKKISKNILLPEVCIYLSGVVLILLDNLRKTYIHEKKQQKVLKQDFIKPVDVLQQHQNYLKNILSNLIEWIMVSDVATNKLRANQYSSLVILLELINFEEKHYDLVTDDSMYVSRLDSSKCFLQDEDKKVLIAIDVLSAFGEKLIENICQDCIAGNQIICRVLAMSSLGLFITVTNNQNWLIFISGRGYLRHIIQSLLDEEDNLVKMLQPSPANLKPLYLYVAKLSLLCRFANLRTGAELLLENRVLSCLSNLKIFRRHPEISKAWNNDDLGLDNITDNTEQKYLQIFLPTFDLCNAILTTLGTDNQSAVTQIMHYLLSHLDVLELILRSGSSTLSPLFLKELSLVTSVISRTANNDLVDILHNPDILQNNRSHLYRIQKLMLSLLPRFILSDSVIRDLISNIGEEENSFQTSERLLFAMQIMCNILCYARNIVANHGIEHEGVGVIFQPTLHDPLLNSATKHNFPYTEETPSLGGIIQQMLCAVNYHHQEKVTLDLLTRKIKEIPEMNSIDLREFVPETKKLYDLPSIRKHVYEFVSEKLQKKKQELEYCAYIIENCLYLVWTHLDYYMLRAIPKGRMFGHANLNLTVDIDQTLASASEATWKVSTDDISNLKQGLVSVFNDSFCKRLLETAQDRSEFDKGLLEALLRKIKRLIQFVPVK